LGFSCLARFLTLGARYSAEAETFTKAVAGKLPYQFMYSGGEICPVPDSNGRLKNRFHNFTLVTCRLK